MSRQLRAYRQLRSFMFTNDELQQIIAVLRVVLRRTREPENRMLKSLEEKIIQELNHRQLVESRRQPRRKETPEVIVNAILSSYWQGISYRKIAQTMKVPYSYVRTICIKSLAKANSPC